MFWMLVSKETPVLKYAKTIVRIIVIHKSHGCFSKEAADSLPKERCSVCSDSLAFTRCGKKMSTKRMVPMSIKAAKNPRSLSAGELSGISAAKAPTVVMLPMRSGGTISFKSCLIEWVLSVWATKWSG